MHLFFGFALKIAVIIFSFQIINMILVIILNYIASKLIIFKEK